MFFWIQWYVALPKRLIFERLFRGKAHKFLTFTNFPGEYNFYIGNKSKRVNVPVFSSASCVAVKFYWLIPFPCCLLQIPTLLVFRNVSPVAFIPWKASIILFSFMGFLHLFYQEMDNNGKLIRFVAQEEMNSHVKFGFVH